MVSPRQRGRICLAGRRHPVPCAPSRGVESGRVGRPMGRRFRFRPVGGAMIPIARTVSLVPAALPALAFEWSHAPVLLQWTPGLGLGHTFLLTWGILVLALGLLIALVFAHVLRTSAHGFDLRTVGSNPLAAVAAGVDVDLVQLWMLAAGGGCAGLTGALPLWA